MTFASTLPGEIAPKNIAPGVIEELKTFHHNEVAAMQGKSIQYFLKGSCFYKTIKANKQSTKVHF